MSSIGSLGGNSLVQLISSQSEYSLAGNKTTDESNATTEKASNDRGIDALKTKMDAAISDALKNLDKSASTDKIMQTIKSAVDGVLKENGINPEAMKSNMRPAGQDTANMPLPPPPNGGSDDFMAKIEALLQENGFDVEKFKSEMNDKKAQQDNSSIELLDSLNSAQGIDAQA